MDNKILSFAAVLVLAASPIQLNAQVEKSAYVCLIDSAVGLDWAGIRWQVSSFKTPGTFRLTVRTQHDLAWLSAKGDDLNIHCVAELDLREGIARCITSLGETIYFSQKDKRGAIAYLLGAATPQRDSLAVMPFVCERF